MDSSVTTVSNTPSATLIRIRCNDHRQTVWSIGSAPWYTRLLSWWYRTVPGSAHVSPRRVRLCCNRQSFPFAFSPTFARDGLLERQLNTASAPRPCSPVHDRPCARPAAAVRRSPCNRRRDATAVTATDRFPTTPCTNAIRFGCTIGRGGCCSCQWCRGPPRRAQGNDAVLAFPRTAHLTQTCRTQTPQGNERPI